MELRRLGILIVVCLAGLGCRRDPYMDAYFEMLNSEKRVLEDRLYELEYDHKKALKELEAYRAGEKTADPQAREPSDDRGESEDNGQINADEMEMQIPEIELPPGFESGHRLRPDKPAFRTASVSGRPKPALEKRKRLLSDEELADAIIAALDQNVDHIAINPHVTGGAELNSDPGDDGITVLIEPRNRLGHFVANPADLTIVLLDPALSGEQARIGRWDIDRAAAQKALRDGSRDRGMQFRLPWSGARPRNDRLHLFVRYVCEDGRVLETEREIRIQPAGRVAQRWTPRSSQSPERDSSREVMADCQSPVQESKPAVVQAVAEEPISIPAENLPTSDAAADDDARALRVRDLWKPER